MAERTLEVEGMSCDHCKMAVSGALNGLDGVSAVSVDLAAGKVDVSYDEKKVSFEQMKDAVEDQGYDVVK
ncbi:MULTISPECIES: copper chaperone CopZ [unclassified Sporolactobacillus]|uniref:copper chaperone CopZ n=1 Tax=unclassified Sporolactobacillus TaxID=2628533 RepID=UPI002367F727|nr:copper chaperone CopZ [Sporolactobacillus sp. CQH2019]MDD9149460.1 copper chaperone CopZ [Sporolactobacillus sp. CQH2019]